MGYQLKRVRLCSGSVEDCGAPFSAVVVLPTCHTVGVAELSTRSCGGLTDHAVHLPPLFAVHTGTVPVVLRPASVGIEPLVARSAGSCSSRIAFGLIGFVPEAVGAVRPRANPSDSHSLVTGTHVPELFRYSTRNQPSIRFQVAVRFVSALVFSAKLVLVPTSGKYGDTAHPAVEQFGGMAAASGA